MPTPNQLAIRSVAPRPVRGEFLLAYIEDSGAATDLAVDGSTPVSYLYTVPANKVALIYGVKFKITDAGIVEDGFGGVATLANGFTVKTLDAVPADALDLLGGQTLKNHIDLASLCGAANVTTVIGGTNDTVSASLDLVELCGGPLQLAAAEAFEVSVEDDVSGLVSMFVNVHGLLLDAD